MQKNCLSFEQGDIIIADILYSNQIGFKRRPVLVISNTKYNACSDDLIVLSISSTNPKTKYDIQLNNKHLDEGELKTESKILVDFSTTLEKSTISQKIGKTSEHKMKEVKQKLKELYDL